MLFTQPLPAPHLRMIGAMSTGSQDAGGSCPELSSHKEAGLEASILLAPSDGRENVAALEVRTFHEYRSTAPGDTTIEACSLPLASHELLTNMSSEDVCNCICRQCGTGKDRMSANLAEGNSPERELSARYSGLEVSM